jgi:hypothetical protein
MSTLSLRLPESLHAAARRLAEQENISLNQLITVALAEKLSALATEDYLASRAARASRERFDQVLAKVPAAPPDDRDRLEPVASP